MKTILIPIAIAGFVTGAVAQTRPSTLAMPCSAIRQLVLAQGAVVLGTGGYTYDRFVRDGTFCAISEYTLPAFVPCRDTPSCFIGYRCRQGPRDWWD